MVNGSGNFLERKSYDVVRDVPIYQCDRICKMFNI